MPLGAVNCPELHLDTPMVLVIPSLDPPVVGEPVQAATKDQAAPLKHSLRSRASILFGLRAVTR